MNKYVSSLPYNVISIECDSEGTFYCTYLETMQDQTTKLGSFTADDVRNFNEIQTFSENYYSFELIYDENNKWFYLFEVSDGNTPDLPPGHGKGRAQSTHCQGGLRFFRLRSPGWHRGHRHRTHHQARLCQPL